MLVTKLVVFQNTTIFMNISGELVGLCFTLEQQQQKIPLKRSIEYHT